MVSPEFLQNYDTEAIHVEDELQLGPKDHLTAQSLILSAAKTFSHNYNADKRTVGIYDIPLTGSVPLRMQRIMGAGYRKMDVTIMQTPSEDKDPSIRIALKDSDLTPETVITTHVNPTPYARDKFFWIHRQNKPMDEYCRGDDVGDLLDSVLKTGDYFAKATDPRKQPLSVGGLTNSIEHMANKHKPSGSARVETLTYGNNAYDFALDDKIFFPYERNTGLSISKSGNSMRYKLDIFGPHTLNVTSEHASAPENHYGLPVFNYLGGIATGHGTVMLAERVQYQFDQLDKKQIRHLSSRIMVSSRHLSEAQLRRHLQHSSSHPHNLKRLHRAVQDIYSSKSQTK